MGNSSDDGVHELHTVNKAFDAPPDNFDHADSAEVRKDVNGEPTSTDTDAVDMARMGRTQQLTRNFKSISLLGLASTTMSTWTAIMLTSSFSLINGGMAGTIWLAFASWICIMSVALSLAELASMAPTSGGQYHWVSEFAPAAWQKLLSYLVGWLSALAWQALIATTAFSFAGLALGLASLHNPSYIPTNWQTTLLMIAIGLVATLFNTFGAKKLPLIEGLIMFLYLLGFFCIIIPLWVLSPKASASDVFGKFSNFGGWPSQGTACFVGSLSATSAFAGTDAAAHLAEEVKDASRTVPRMMITTVLLNGAMGFVMIITYVFCITNIEAVALSESAFPFVDVFYAGTASKAGATAMAVLPLVLAACTVLNALAAASRQAWALSRDDGLPFSPWFQRIVTIGTPIPINAIIFSLTILIILSLINIGSTTAFNSIVGLLTSASAFSYILSIGCVLRKRLRGDPMPPSRFSLGKFGAPINAFAICYTFVAAVASFFPLTVPVTAESMNWSVVMFVGVMAIAATDYIFRGRKNFIPPVKRVHQA